MRNIVKWATIVVAFILIGLAMAYLADRQGQTLDSLDRARQARADLRADVAAQADALEEANRRLRDAGEPTVPVPPAVGPPGPQGERGPRGEPGPAPTDADVRRAVAAYCADTGVCEGRDGADVTRSQVTAAVATYCNARGECRGTEGRAGEPGAPGPRGPQGPGPTDEQVQQAVEAYCSDDRCRGPQGPTGPQGPRGEPGTARPGDYQCPEGQYVRGIAIAADGTVTLTCQDPTGVPIL